MLLLVCFLASVSLISGSDLVSLEENLEISKRVFDLADGATLPFYISLESTFCLAYQQGFCADPEVKVCGASLISDNEFVTAMSCLESHNRKLLSTRVDFYPLERRQKCCSFFYPQRKSVILNRASDFIVHHVLELAIGKLRRNQLPPETSKPIPLCDPRSSVMHAWIAKRSQPRGKLTGRTALMTIEEEEVTDDQVLRFLQTNSIIFTASIGKTYGISTEDIGGSVVALPHGELQLCLRGIVMNYFQREFQLQRIMLLVSREVRDFVLGEAREHDIGHPAMFTTL